jgi:hypothetical protein
MKEQISVVLRSVEQGRRSDEWAIARPDKNKAFREHGYAQSSRTPVGFLWLLQHV